MASRPTPHSIALSALIALHCEDEPLLYDNDSEGFSKVDAFLQKCMLQQQQDHWSHVHGLPLPHFLSDFRDVVGRDIASGFTDWLKVAASSIDALIDLMSSIRTALQTGRVDATSANGIFLRQVRLGFEELSFEATVALWEDFSKEVRYCDRQTTEQKWTLSPDQIDSALNSKCLAMSTMRSDDHEMQAQLHGILAHNPELPSAQFLRFLHCLEQGERVGAVDALHQYLDYALIQETDRDEILQFAAILKATLHHSMGDKFSSLEATEEAVRVAQQSQDAACVAFALGWLSVFAEPDQAGALIQRCIQRATEGQLRILAAGSNLSMALSSTQTNPSEAWMYWMDASTDPPSAQADNPWDRPTHMAHLESGDQALIILARQRLVAAGIWDGFGQIALSGLSSSTALLCHGDKLSTQEVEVAVQNIARVALFGSTSIISLNDIAVGKHVDGKASCVGKVSSCYGSVILKIVQLRSAFHLPLEGVFLFEVALTVHEWAVRRGDLVHAQAICQAMQGHLHPRMHNYDTVVMDVFSQECLLLSRLGRWSEAVDLAKEMIEKSRRSGKRTNTARLLFLLASIHLESDPHQFNSALPPLLECLTLTDENKMDSLHAAALSILAQVHLRMGSFRRALAVLHASLPTLLQQEQIWLRAEAYLTLAKCHLRRMKEEHGFLRKKLKTRLLKLAAQELKRSEKMFRLCQDFRRLQEIYYLLSRVYNSMPKSRDRRERAAKNFLQTSRYLVQTEQLDAQTVIDSLSSQEGLLKIASRSIPVQLLTSHDEHCEK